MLDLDVVHVRGGNLTIHRSEKRLYKLKENLNSLSCGWAKVCRSVKPDHLLYEMEQRYCIKCNCVHWFFTKPIEFEQKKFDPNQYYISELYEMGYFDQFDDSESE